jgi:hypothetical protein
MLNSLNLDNDLKDIREIYYVVVVVLKIYIKSK